MRWFRFYSEALNDPKVQNLPPHIFKIWINCLCLASSIDSSDGKIGTLSDVSFAFRETKDTVSSAFHALMDTGLIVTDGETFQLPKWVKRQYKSDCSTERVKRFRKRHETVSETAPDTEQNRAETEQKKEPLISPLEKPLGEKNAKRTRKPSSFITQDFRGDIGTIKLASELGIDFGAEQQKFIDYWLANGKQKSDWQAAFRNWLKRAKEFSAERKQRATAGRPGVRDVTGAALRVIALHSQTQS